MIKTGFKSRAFTIIELLVVIVVIGILATIIPFPIPVFPVRLS